MRCKANPVTGTVLPADTILLCYGHDCNLVARLSGLCGSLVFRREIAYLCDMSMRRTGSHVRNVLGWELDSPRGESPPNAACQA